VGEGGVKPVQKFNVLMYHELIKEKDLKTDDGSQINVKQNYQDKLPRALFVYLKEFKKQMDYLYQAGYKTLKLQDIIDFYYQKKAPAEKSVLITFDDMYQSVLLYAYPILKEYNFNAVGFVVSDWLFDQKKSYSPLESRCLSKNELTKMKDVFEYANHSAGLHRRNNNITDLEKVGKNEFIDDTKSCEKYIDSKNVYAFPFGKYTENTIENLKELNYKLAFTTIAGANNINTNPLELKRNAVLLNYQLEDFKKILTN
jgi:peptidoglycan/xylan/chitin deacetylase (PgdA/CDA1 family)